MLTTKEARGTAVLVVLLVLGTSGMRLRQKSEASDIPQPCCSPSQFEANQELIQPVTGGQVVKTYSRISFDYDNQLSAINRSTISPQGQVYQSQTVYDGKTHTFYVFDPNSKSCISRSFTSFGLICVPADYAYAFTLVIGEPKSSVNGLVFEITGSGTPARMIVSQTLCAPIQQTYFSHGDELIVETTYNLTLGIKDPSVFDIPPECKHTEKTSALFWSTNDRGPRNLPRSRFFQP